jgi:hypothetical protein
VDHITSLRERATTPAPSASVVTPELAAYVRASERVAKAIKEQAECIRRLRAVDSLRPLATMILPVPSDELVDPEPDFREPPPASGFVRRNTVPGGLVAPSVCPVPVTDRVLAAVALGPRPRTTLR